MHFLNSALFPFLSLLSIPVIIHLINRRRAVEHRFAAFEFLFRSKIITSKRLNLKQLLIMLCRIVILLCLVLGAAMPVLYGKDKPVKGGETRILAIVDNSASMAFIEKGESGLSAGMAFLERRIGLENIAAIRLSPLNGEPHDIDFLGADGEFARKTAFATQTFSAGRFEKPLRDALQAAAATGDYSRLLVISDFAENNWKGVPDSVFASQPLPVVLARTSPESLFENHAVLGIDKERDLSPSSGAGLIRVECVNSARRPENDLAVGLWLSARNVLNGFISLPAGGSGAKEFVLDAFGSEEPGMAVLPPDSLAVDDRRYFVHVPPVSVKALLIDGDPAAHYTLAETYFVEKALSASAGAEVRVVSPAAFDPALLKNIRVLFLCNFIPSGEPLKRILEFTERGGGLFMAPGNRVTPEDFNSRMAPLFGRTLRDRKSGLGHASAEEARLSPEAADHPAVALLSGITDADRYLFRDLFLLEPSPENRTQTLLRLTSGEPLLLETRPGKGRAFLYLSSLDLEWNDFPLRPFFAPFLLESARYLSGRDREAPADSFRVGDTLLFDVAGSVRIDAPSGGRHFIEGRGGRILFSETGLPGHYRLTDASGRERLFAVNLDPAESTPVRLSDERLDRIFAGNPVVHLDVRNESGARIFKPRPLWHHFFFLALLFALFESLLTASFWKRKE